MEGVVVLRFVENVETIASPRRKKMKAISQPAIPTLTTDADDNECCEEVLLFDDKTLPPRV